MDKAYKKQLEELIVRYKKERDDAWGEEVGTWCRAVSLAEELYRSAFGEPDPYKRQEALFNERSPQSEIAVISASGEYSVIIPLKFFIQENGMWGIEYYCLHRHVSRSTPMSGIVGWMSLADSVSDGIIPIDVAIKYMDEEDQREREWAREGR